MSLQAQISALAGARGTALKSQKKAIANELTPEMLTAFLAEATPGDVAKVTDLYTRAYLYPPTARAVLLFEATYADVVTSRTKLDKSFAKLRTALVARADASAVLACLERHPDADLVDRVRSEGTLDELRRAVAIEKPRPYARARTTARRCAGRAGRAGGRSVGEARLHVEAGATRRLCASVQLWARRMGEDRPDGSVPATARRRVGRLIAGEVSDRAATTPSLRRSSSATVVK
ncbi:hypothetical protein BH11MYX1_BH11MYX1_33460 [soil metagenome]